MDCDGDEFDVVQFVVSGGLHSVHGGAHHGAGAGAGGVDEVGYPDVAF